MDLNEQDIRLSHVETKRQKVETCFANMSKRFHYIQDELPMPGYLAQTQSKIDLGP